MSYIEVNDIFDQLIDENKRLKECLKVLIEYKNFVDLVINKLNSNLDSNDLIKCKELHNKIETIVDTRELGQSLSDNKICNDLKDTKPKRTRTKVIESLNRYVNPNDQERIPWSHLNGVYVCGFVGCGKEYASKMGFDYHINTHRKRFVCDYEGCNYRTGIRKTFKFHLNTHKVIKPYKCTLCPKTVSSSKSLYNHMKLLHQCLEEPLTCGIDGCSKVFDNEFRLSLHQNFRHLMEKRFNCDFPECHFKSVTKALLRSHLMSHSEHRPWICDVEGCAMTFKTQWTMNKHKLTHITVRNFKCESHGCDKTFKSMQSLKRHEKAVHSGIIHLCNWPGCEFETNCDRSLQTHKLVHSTERNFHCQWPQCGKSFKRSIDLRNHLRIHNNERRYACSWPGCQYSCVFGGNLRKHMRVHQKTSSADRICERTT